MEKPPYVPTNAELYKELQNLQHQVSKLQFDIEVIKAENETIRRNMHHSGR